MNKKILLPIFTIALTVLLLFGVSAGLKHTAEENARTERLEMMHTLLPGSASFTEEPYSGEDPIIQSVYKGETGFIVETCTSGYAGDITMLVGVTLDGTVNGLVVRDLSETWGLGRKSLTDQGFLSQFVGIRGEVAVGTGTDAFSGATDSAEEEATAYVDGITGATVTSKAVVRSINAAVAFVTGADTESGATSWGG